MIVFGLMEASYMAAFTRSPGQQVGEIATGSLRSATILPRPSQAEITPMHTTFFHNPRCSKSRAALALLQERGIEPQVIAYLEQPPSIDELVRLLALLGLADVRALMRQSEAEYKELGLDDSALPQSVLIATLAEHPRLIERPIFVHNNQAIIGRPPERILDIL